VGDGTGYSGGMAVGVWAEGVWQWGYGRRGMGRGEDPQTGEFFAVQKLHLDFGLETGMPCLAGAVCFYSKTRKNLLHRRSYSATTFCPGKLRF